ncbi:N-6 DNA Methylase [Actinomadura mexicana]|uniref:site-specific DNA-methyltransferase (adenine-specific) n=2 Tax=Actinomadura mexicana TaxID=134959 RepID=A0A239DLM3_9ACTN|nr:N-6 DNA Methylase [Actinomadura mexicana]
MDSQVDGLSGLRKRLWNYGRVPLLIVSDSDSSTTVFNALSNPRDDSNPHARPLSTASHSERAEEVLKAFARKQVEAGVFARDHLASYRDSRRVDRSLLKNLRYFRQRHGRESLRRASAIDDLVGGTLIVSYLVDRQVLDARHLYELTGTQDFNSLLMGGVSSTLRLFEGLAQKFNGDVFGAMPDAIMALDDEDLQAAAALLRGDDLATGQTSLWPYDFSIVPPDLVSSVYEQLLEDKRASEATHYTPKFLVNLVLDELLPLDSDDMPRIVDLACGSGAFITEAFRRLVYRQSRVSSTLGYNQLTEVLQKHIFGIDINKPAARATVFGLYLSLLEQVDPPTIWDSVVLPQLIGKNVVVADAFDDHALSGETFDIVVSNPPWVSKITGPAQRFLKEKDRHIGDKQLAQAFVWLATEMLKPGGSLGLVMPAKAMLHNRSKPNLAFRAAAFKELEFRTVVDLSALRKNIFAHAIAPTAVVVARRPDSRKEDNSRRADRSILHVAPHNRTLNVAIDGLVIAPEEIRAVSSLAAIHRPDIWKVLLWGSVRDLELIDKLRLEHPTLESVVAENNWAMGQGFKDAPRSRQKDASELRGLPELDSSLIDPLHVSSLPTKVFDRPTLHRHSPALYRGPMVLIRRTMPRGRLTAAFYENDVVYSSDATGIAGATEDSYFLKAITAVLVSSLAQYWHFLTAASWGVERDSVDPNELRTMPIAKPDEHQMRVLEEIFSTPAPFEDLAEDIDNVVFDMYKLDDMDRERVLQGVVQGVRRFQANARAVPTVDDATIGNYRSVLASRLSASLPDLVINTSHYFETGYSMVSVHFSPESRQAGLTEQPSSIDLGRFTDSLASNARTTAVIAQPAGFFIDGDSVYIVKTLDRDRWSYNAALDDADRIFSALAFEA